LLIGEFKEVISIEYANDPRKKASDHLYLEKTNIMKEAVRF